jgi:NAD+ synthase
MLSNPKEVALEISEWMKGKAAEAGRDGFVVGISGGIDSAVAYRLAQMTGLRVQPIFLPKDREQDERLRPLVEELCGFVPVKIFIDELVDLEALPYIHESDRRKLAYGNVAARARMTSLYYMAEYFQCIVVGTTNAAEWYIGYYTKYGDGGVDIEPICGLSKHEVYQLGREGFDVPVPDSILNVAPSANLWPGQTDEGELGYTYDQLDAYIQGKEPMTVPLGVQVKIDATHDKTEHKRNQPDHCCISERDCLICTHEG